MFIFVWSDNPIEAATLS